MIFLKTILIWKDRRENKRDQVTNNIHHGSTISGTNATFSDAAILITLFRRGCSG